MKTAKYRLTVLLHNEINYGHTIDEAEKVDAISNAMEVYAKERNLELINLCADLYESVEFIDKDLEKRYRELI